MFETVSRESVTPLPYGDHMLNSQLPITRSQEAAINRLTGRRPRWQRRVIRTRVAVGAVIVLVTVAGLVGAVDADTGPLQTIEHRVEPGDTLWSIASSVTDPGDDVRATVHTLMEINVLSESDLSIGQVVLVPVLP